MPFMKDGKHMRKSNSFSLKILHKIKNIIKTIFKIYELLKFIIGLFQ